MKTQHLLLLLFSVVTAHAAAEKLVSQLPTNTTFSVGDYILVNTGSPPRSVLVGLSNALESFKSFPNWPAGSATNAQPPSANLTNFSLITTGAYVARLGGAATNLVSTNTTVDGAMMRSGGNTRGTNAVDLQSVRSAATQVASGEASFIGPGSARGTASGAQSVILTGQDNFATGNQSMVLWGQNATNLGVNSYMGAFNSWIGPDCITLLVFGTHHMAGLTNADGLGIVTDSAIIQGSDHIMGGLGTDNIIAAGLGSRIYDANESGIFAANSGTISNAESSAVISGYQSSVIGAGSFIKQAISSGSSNRVTASLAHAYGVNLTNDTPMTVDAGVGNATKSTFNAWGLLARGAVTVNGDITNQGTFLGQAINGTAIKGTNSLSVAGRTMIVSPSGVGSIFSNTVNSSEFLRYAEGNDNVVVRGAVASRVAVYDANAGFGASSMTAGELLTTLTNLAHSPLAAGQIALTNGNLTRTRNLKSLQAGNNVTLDDQTTNIVINATSGAQTPWTSDINADGNDLTNAAIVQATANIIGPGHGLTHFGPGAMPGYPTGKHVIIVEGASIEVSPSTTHWLYHLTNNLWQASGFITNVVFSTNVAASGEKLFPTMDSQYTNQIRPIVVAYAGPGTNVWLLCNGGNHDIASGGTNIYDNLKNTSNYAGRFKADGGRYFFAFDFHAYYAESDTANHNKSEYSKLLRRVPGPWWNYRYPFREDFRVSKRISQDLTHPNNNGALQIATSIDIVMQAGEYNPDPLGPTVYNENSMTGEGVDGKGFSGTLRLSSSPNPALVIYNEDDDSTFALKPIATNGYVFFGRGTNIPPKFAFGTSTNESLTNFHALYGFRMSSGTPGSGKVMTSDADGDATWETPSGGAGGADIGTLVHSVVIFDEFLAGSSPADGFGPFEWDGTAAGSGAVLSPGNGDTNEPGTLALFTGTTTTGTARITSGSTAGFVFGSSAFTNEVRFRLQALPDGTETYAFRLGWTDNTTADAVDGVYLRGSTASANFRYVTRTNSVETDTDSGLVMAAGVWYKLRIVIAANGGTATFTIDGANSQAVTTNIPTGVGRETQLNLHIVKSAGTTSRYLELGYCYLGYTLSASR